MDPYEILVIILAVFLAIFLILAIVLSIILINILNRIKLIVDKAEQMADKAEHVSEFFKKTAGSVAIGKLLGNITDVVKRHGKKK